MVEFENELTRTLEKRVDTTANVVPIMNDELMDKIIASLILIKTKFAPV